MIKVRLNQAAVLSAIAKRNMSQNMLAIRAGTSSAYISQVLRGVRYPSPAMRRKLQDALAPLTFDEIFVIEEGKTDGPDSRG
jgi:transcriptional regulator with XRE-family HTH domain